jgi:Protein of unknown function (DUF2892)
MTRNVGSLDRTIRVLFAATVALAYIMGWISGTLTIVLGVVAVVMLVTGLVSFCPLYRILGVNSCSLK